MNFETVLNYIFLLATILIIYLNWRKLLPNPNIEKIECFIEKHASKLVLLILLIFTVAKLYRLAELPYEHLDEQFLMYQVKSFLTIGTDMYGAKLPVYSRAWGWGMSMGYIYLACIFCKLFGVSYFTVRLPMLLIGTIAGWFIYLIAKNKGQLFGVVTTLIYCTIPFNFFAQRWALDRTLFPFIFIIATYFAIEYFKKQKPWFLCISFIFYGLSLYGYANAYIIVPIFLLCCLFYGMKNKKIRLKDTIVPTILLIIIALPLFLFVLKSVFGVIDIDKFLFLTIPDIKTDRGGEIGLHLGQISTIIQILFGRCYDANITTTSTGLYYLFMIPFVLLGIASFLIKTIRKENDLVDFVTMSLLIISILYGIVILDSDAGKLNILMFVFPLLITEGIYFCFRKNNTCWLITITMAILCFATNITCYFANDGYLETYIKELTPAGVETVLSDIQYDKELEGKNIYLVCFKHIASPSILNSAVLTEEEMKTLEYISYTHQYYGNAEAFVEAGRIKLLKPWVDSPSFLAELDGTNFELDSNGVYVIPIYEEDSGNTGNAFKALEEKVLQVTKHQYTSEFENYNIYY